MTAEKRIIHVQIKTDRPTGCLVLTAKLAPTLEEKEDEILTVSGWRLLGAPHGLERHGEARGEMRSLSGDEESLLEILSRDLAAEFGTEGFELKIERV